MNPTTFTNSTINSSSKKRRDCVNLLPSNYVPLDDTVIIGYGSGDIRHVEGNTRLETMVQTNLDEYSKTKRRADKARIISNIVDEIQTRCRRDGGGHGFDEPAFVKFDGDNYWTITDRASREKVTSIFRNHLSHKYKSSSKWKTEKKRAIRKQRKEQQQQKQNPIVGTEDRTAITISRNNVITGDIDTTYHGHDDKLTASSWNIDLATPKTTTVPMSPNQHHHVCFSARLCDIDDMMKEESTSEFLLEQVSTTIFDGDKGDDIESNNDVTTTTVLSVEDIKATGRRSFIELLPSKSVGAILPPIDDFSNIFNAIE